MNMVKEASLRKLNKYKVMRGLYYLDKTKNDLLAESGMHSFQLKDALDSLLKFGDIEKVKNVDESHNDAVTTLTYRLTEKGKEKLAYYEYKYALNQKYIPPYEKGKMQRKYESEITHIILNSSYYNK
jgi:hypothetical protein